MHITWKVRTVQTAELEATLNEMSEQDYEVYRLEYVVLGESENGFVPLPAPSQPSQIHINNYGSGQPTYTTPSGGGFQNTPPGNTVSGSMSSNRTISGHWIIVAMRAE